MDNFFIFPARPVAYSTSNKSRYVAAKFRREESKLSYVSSQVVGQHTVYFVHDIPLRIMYNLQVCFKSSERPTKMEAINGGNPSLLTQDQSKYEMLGDETGTGWTQHSFFKNKHSYQLFDVFEVFLKKSLSFIKYNEKSLDGKMEELSLDGESFVCHKPGYVVTNATAHQELHVDCEDVFTMKKNECFIYHVPLSPEGMSIRVADICVSSDEESLRLFGRMLFVPFGCMLLIPPTLIHSGHYGECGSIRAHGIISKDKCVGKSLILIDDIANLMFPKLIGLPLNNYGADLDALCPRCFNKIEFVTEKEHLRKCKPKKLNHVNLASKFCY